MRAMLLALGLLAAPAASDERPVAAEEFRAYAEGWTLHFERDGRPFGVERYDPGDRVLWKPEGGDCAPGVWGEADGAICFLYDRGAACWRLFRDAAGLFARPAEGDGPAVRVIRRDRAPLLCAGTPAV